MNIDGVDKFIDFPHTIISLKADQLKRVAEG